MSTSLILLLLLLLLQFHELYHGGQHGVICHERFILRACWQVHVARLLVLGKTIGCRELQQQETNWYSMLLRLQY